MKDLLRQLVQRDFNKRSWDKFFNHPVIKNEPHVYRQILQQYSQDPKRYLKASTVQSQSQSQSEAIPQAKTDNKKEDPKEEEKASLSKVEEDKNSINSNRQSSATIEDFLVSQEIVVDVLTHLFS